MALVVHRSNRTERLVEALAGVVSEPLPTRVTAGETVVVQGRGMAHWVALELAERLGIWANRDFPFPRAFVERVLTATLGEAPGAAEAFQPETLRWRVAAALAACRDRRELHQVRNYLDDDPRGVKTLQLATLVADTLDQYLVYRPELVAAWEAGDEPHEWQAVLWRELAGVDPPHVARRARRFVEAAADPAVVDAVRARFPRVSVFGLSTLPPLYLDVLAALARAVPVHLFILSPTHHYWADLVAPRDVAREVHRRGRRGRPAAAAAELHLDVGHPLLASLGKVGREFHGLLEGHAEYLEGDDDLFEEPPPTSMLAVLQGDLQHVRNRGADADCPALRVAPADRSIAVHSCHGPMREVEVLHDQLLACFDADPPLAPHDVVVMCPDIDAYAPYIDAVFGRAPGDAQGIPYRITDRRRAFTGEVPVAFSRLLAVVRPRLTATAVLDLLALGPIRERAGITLDDLGWIRSWVEQAGIRWGRDADERAAEGQPAADANTWRFGLDRLLLGYAMEGRGSRVFGAVLPVDTVEGADALALGRLAELCERLFVWRDRLRQARPLTEWQAVLTDAVAAFLPDTNRYAAECRELRQAIASVAERAAAAGYIEPVELEGVHAEVEAEIERDAPIPGFLTGPVTFCALVPMRSIPFRVVCLLGMNDGGFPRSRRPPSFDRRGHKPRAGDRSPRDDDRYLFLEALLCARERLIITYTGQSVRDNAELPPSVVVSELLDVLDQSFRLDDRDAGKETPVRRHVVVTHPLQPFSPRYFQQPERDGLFSYASAACAGAAAALEPRRTGAAFVPAAMPLDPVPDAVTVDDLVRFFRQPVAELCRIRLRLRLREDEDVVDDREPIELDKLEQWALGDLTLRHAERGLAPEASAELLRAAGVLPLGTPGACAVDRVAPVAAAIHTVASERRVPPVVAFLPVDLDLGGMRVTGGLRNVWSRGLVLAQYSRIGGLPELELWIRHLVLCTVRPPAIQPASTLVGRAPRGDGIGVVTFTPVDDAAGPLADLVALYRCGLERPLPLFKGASRAFAEAAATGRGKPIDRARAEYEGNEHDGRRGDLDDPAVRRVFAHGDPLDGSVRIPDPRGGEAMLGFEELALFVFDPLLAHRRVAAADGAAE